MWLVYNDEIPLVSYVQELGIIFSVAFVCDLLPVVCLIVFHTFD